MLARFVDEMFSMRHVKCCCPLGNSHLTHDALISAAALDQNKVTESERETWRAWLREGERANGVTHLKSLTTALAAAARFTCGDIVLKFCASNKVISMKLSLFIVTLCDCVHRESLWRPPNRGLYGSLDLEAFAALLPVRLVLYDLRTSNRDIVLKFHNFQNQKLLGSGPLLPWTCGDSTPRARTQHSKTTKEQTKKKIIKSNWSLINSKSTKKT